MFDLKLRPFDNLYSCIKKTNFLSTGISRSHHLVMPFAIIFSSLISLPLYGQMQFQNATAALGFSNTGQSYGASWGDVNSDGLPDIFVSNHSRVPDLYLNEGNGTFSNASARVNSPIPNADTHGASWSDFDNDGDQDLLQLVGGGSGTGTGANHFYINTNGELHDRASEYGLQYSLGRGRTPLWFDWNNDGRVDVLLANIRRPDGQAPTALFTYGNGTFTEQNSLVGINTLYDNHYAQLGFLTDNERPVLLTQGNRYPDGAYRYDILPFNDIRNSLGFPNTSPITDTAIADFNGDLRSDFYLARVSGLPSAVVTAGPNGLEAAIAVNGDEKSFQFRTNGDVEFEFLPSIRISPSQIYIGSGGDHPSSQKFTVSQADATGTFNHNPGVNVGAYISYDPPTGLWRVDISSPTQRQISVVVKSQSSITNLSNINFVNSNGSFQDKLLFQTGTAVQAAPGGADLQIATACGSVVAGDFDNDTDIDLYLVCLGAVNNLPNIIYENLGNGEFVRIPGAGGAEGSSIGRGDAVAMADYDEDGFLDLLVTNGAGNKPFADGPVELFRNLGNSNNWLEVDLEGVMSNRDGIGARVIVDAYTVSDTDTVKMVRVQDGGMHRFSQNHQRIHFGLGSNQIVDLEIHWPSGTIDSYKGNNAIVANKLYKATEGQDIVEVTRDSPVDPGDECGQPGYDKADPDQRGLYIWKECDVDETESWKIRVTGGTSASTITYAGLLSSDEDFISLTPVSIETDWDILDNSKPRLIDYTLKVIRAGEDGFNFSFASTAQVCFDPSVLPGGASVYLGGSKLSNISAPFDLVTLDQCEPFVPGPECGQPSYSPGSAQNIYLWKDCSVSVSGPWFMRATAGGSTTKIIYTGSVTSSLGFSSGPTPFSIEGNDELDTPNSNQIDFELNMRKAGQDGFQFTFPDGSATCFDASGLPDSNLNKVLLGAGQIEQNNGPFDLDTQGPCDGS